MMYNKRHWDFKSFMMPQANKSVNSLRAAPSCIRTKRFLELLEAFQYSAVLQIFIHDSCEIQMCSQLHCTAKASRKMATSAGNVARLIQAISTSHTQCER